MANLETEMDCEVETPAETGTAQETATETAVEPAKETRSKTTPETPLETALEPARATAEEDARETGKGRVKREPAQDNKLPESFLKIALRDYTREIFKHKEDSDSSERDSADGPPKWIGGHFGDTPCLSKKNHLKNEKLFLVKNLRGPSKNLAVRVRSHISGHAAWMNELRCYSVPDFKHRNIMPLFGYEKYICNGSWRKSKSVKKFWRCRRVEYHNFVSDESLSSLPEGLESDNPKDDDRRDRLFTGKFAYYYKKVSAAKLQEMNSTMPFLRDLPKIRKYRRSIQVLEHKKKEMENRHIKYRLEYWIVTRIGEGIVLRDFLRHNVFTWDQLLSVTLGIMDGLNFMHNHVSFHNDLRGCRKIDDRMIKRKYLNLPAKRSDDPRMTFMAIIHRNLNSRNIVLTPNLKPKIWNFGSVYIFHSKSSFGEQGQDEETHHHKLLLSTYSAPELISGHVKQSVNALKMLDMYSAGMLMWEMLWRSHMPPLDDSAPVELIRARMKMGNYEEPLSWEFEGYPMRPIFLQKAIVLDNARPPIKPCWLAGQQTARYVSLITSLWDSDIENRFDCFDVALQVRELMDYPYDLVVKNYVLGEINRYVPSRNWRYEVRSYLNNTIERKREDGRKTERPPLSSFADSSSESSETSTDMSLKSDEILPCKRFLKHCERSKARKRRAMLRGHYLDGPSFGYLSDSSKDDPEDIKTDLWSRYDKPVDMAGKPRWMEIEKMDNSVTLSKKDVSWHVKTPYERMRATDIEKLIALRKLEYVDKIGSVLLGALAISANDEPSHKSHIEVQTELVPRDAQVNQESGMKRRSGRATDIWRSICDSFSGLNKTSDSSTVKDTEYANSAKSRVSRALRRARGAISRFGGRNTADKKRQQPAQNGHQVNEQAIERDNDDEELAITTLSSQ